MVIVNAPQQQQVRAIKPSSTSSIRLHRNIAMFLLVVAALVVYLNAALLHGDEALVYNDVPDEWWSWTSRQLEEHLECDDMIKAGRPVHSHEDWVSLRNAYRKVVGSERSSLLPNDNVDGFNVSITSKVSPGKGRGVFAEEDIPKGTLVWTSNHQSARFTSGDHFRRFLAAISPEMACDVLLWAYVHDLNDINEDTDEIDLAINCDLDEGSLVNSGGWDDGVVGNIGCIDELDEAFSEEHLSPEYWNSGCAENMFALRDIMAGEELLCSYDEFADEDGWKYFGL